MRNDAAPLRTRQRMPGVTEAVCPCGTAYARTQCCDYDTLWAWRYRVDATHIRTCSECPVCGAELYDDGNTGDPTKCFCKSDSDFCSYCDYEAQVMNDMRPD